MKIKKGLLLTIAATAVLGLASCGGEGGQTGYGDVSTKIGIWATAAEEAVIKEVVDAYNAKQTDEKSKFSYEFTAVSEADCGTTLAKDPTVSGAPALFLCADDHINNLVSLDIIAELKGKRAETIKANNSEAAVLGVTNSDKIYGYPVTSDNGYFLWYNKAELSDVSSLESILKTAKEKGKHVLMDVPNGWYANSFIMSPEACGTTSLSWKKNSEGKVVYDTTWDSDTGVKVSEYIAGLLTPYYADGTLQIGSNDVISSGFNDGSLIAAVSGTWMEKDIQNAIGDDMAASKLPEYHIDGKAYQMASFTGTKVYGINKTRPAAEQKVAAALADLLTTKESQLTRFEVRASLPCNLEAQKDESYTKKVSVGGKALNAQNQFACVQAQTAEDRYWDIGKAIGQAYIDSNLGGKTWTQFLKDQMDTLRKSA